MATKTSRKTYRAWLELEIDVDPKSFKLPLPQRLRLFRQRIKAGLATLEQASPGITKKFSVPFPSQPFAFTGSLTRDEIRAIWNISELRFLADRDKNDFPDPAPDKRGLLPFIVSIHQHHQEEGKRIVEINKLTLLIRSKNAKQAKADALEQCRTMSSYVMGSGFRLTKRWWTAEHAYLNTMREEERSMIGSAVQIGTVAGSTEKGKSLWTPNARIDRVTYGGPKERPETWKWMLA